MLGASGRRVNVVEAGHGTENTPEAEVGAAGTNDALGSAEALTLADDGAGGMQGFVLSRLSAPGDVDYYSFDTTAGQVIGVVCRSARGGSGVTGLTVSLRDGADAELAMDVETATDNAVIMDYAPSAAGTFYLRLSKTGQDATVTGDWVRCGVHTGPPAAPSAGAGTTHPSGAPPGSAAATSSRRRRS